MTSTLPDTQKTTDERWRFWRDVLVFELKMFIGNLRDLALMPVSVVAAMIDLVSKGEREGSLFYRVLRWGAHSAEIGVLVREYEKGGTAATIKAALDRAIDQLHRETGKHRERTRSVVVKAIEGGKKLGEAMAKRKEEE